MGTWDFEDDKTGKDIAYVLEHLKEDQDGLQEYKRVASIMDMQANLTYITDYGIGTITPPYKRKVT